MRPLAAVHRLRLGVHRHGSASARVLAPTQCPSWLARVRVVVYVREASDMPDKHNLQSVALHRRKVGS